MYELPEPHEYVWNPDGTFNIGQERCLSPNTGPCHGWEIYPIFTADQMQAAHAAGRASRDSEIEALRADAARYQWLKDNCSYHYSMQPDSPAEHGINYQWQQGTYEERNQGLDGSIDAAMAIDAARAAQEE